MPEPAARTHAQAMRVAIVPLTGAGLSAEATFKQLG